MDLIIKHTTAHWGADAFTCTHGRLGFTDDKWEGDGKTPLGAFPFRRAFYRADRLSKPETALPLAEITPTCGWCDDPSSAFYNTYIQKPFTGSHEDLWLDKPMYDLIIVVGQNDSPPVAGKGSAIFIHLASPEFGPTQGCIGLELPGLLKILREATTKSRLIVEA